MAHFIPVGQPEDYHDSNAERMVYNAFRKLPNNYIVFYSLKWGREYDSRYQKGEADFLLFDPSRGFLVIEVKGGGIKKDDKGRWFSIDKSGYEHQLRYSPLDQAWRSARRFMDLLSDSSDRDIRRYPVIPTVWFPSVRMNEIQGDLPSDYQPSNTFTYPDLEDPEKAINLAFDYNNARRVPPEMATREKIDAVIQVFAPSFHIVPSVSIEIQEREYMFNQLTNEQAALLDYLVEQRTAGIQGAGGTGKTMIALECARRLPKDTNVLFLCFNKMILQYLRDNFSEEMPNVTFSNLNQLYAQSGGQEYANDDEITDFLLSGFSDNYQFDHIIIDEGQDFAADHLDFLMDIVQATGGYFYIFYDKNQLVHKWGSDVDQTIEWLKKLDCRLVLNKNCRNTYQIAKTAYSPFGLDRITLAERINGDTPCINNYSSIEEAIHGIAETIRFYTDKGYKRKQITILTLKTLTKTILAGRESIDGYRLTNDLNGDGILFTTARKYKGLESDVVIVVDFDEQAFKDDNAKSVFYVACSRAKHCLTFIASLDDAEMTKMVEDLGGNPTNEPRRNLKKALSVDFQFIR
ncbi:ATP-binding domain-containing protein [Candidatus Saccharibacteria bacterium]|nr:ATP-binding domain-containing protein [Candidatus Saccharibacteria bacterium]